MVEQNDMLVDWQLTAFISSSIWVLLTPPCFKEKCLQNRFILQDYCLHAQCHHLSDLFSPICWNWFRTQYSPPFYLSGATSLHAVRAAQGPPMDSNLCGKSVPPTECFPAGWPTCCIAGSACLAVLYSLCSKWMIAMIRTQGHRCSDVHVCSPDFLARRFKTLNTSKQKKE